MHVFRSRLCALCSLLLLFVCAAGSPGRTQAQPLTGPLRVSPVNPRYFTDNSGKAIYLTGSHTWASLQDMGQTNPPPAFDFGAYLDFLDRHHHNFIRLWRWEFPRWTERKNQGSFYCVPQPWPRTGPGEALDGQPKFDLEKWDEGYFRRLRERTEAAGKRGIYVSIMLFEGWGLRFVPDGHKAHPFHPANNLNKTGNELKDDFKGIDLFTMAAPRLTALQEAYVRKVIDTVNDLDNVLYEIANESDFSTTEWQYHMIRFIKAYESTKPKQHPVGMTSIGYGVDDLERLLKSPADWISPNPDHFDYKTNPPASDGAIVIILDTDHLWGVGGGVPWVWKSFLRGHNPIWMDPLDKASPWEPTPTYAEAVRNDLGYTRRFAERMNLASMKPCPELASTGYCLANAGAEYLVYQPNPGEPVAVTLEPGVYRYEWFNPSTGTAAGTGRVEALAGSREFKAPFNGESVLYLKAERSASRPTIYAWFPERFGSWKTDGIQWDCLTHLCFRSVELTADGKLRRMVGNPPKEFIETAHRHGVKVTVLVWARSRADSDGYLAKSPQEAAKSLLAYVKENNLDGVNIDDEQMGATNAVAQAPNRELVTRFFQILAKTFKSADTNYHISFAAPPVIAAKDRFGTSWLDLKGIAEVVDGIIPMGYTQNPPSAGWTTNPEPLGGGGHVAWTTTRDIQTMVQDYLEAMGGHKEKLLVGVSLKLGGYEWRCRTDAPLSPTLDKGVSRSLAECEAKARQHGARWHDAQKSPWYCYRDGDAFVQGWFSDLRSWQAKLDSIKAQGLGGVGIWVLDGVNDPPETWQALRELNTTNSEGQRTE